MLYTWTLKGDPIVGEMNVGLGEKCVLSSDGNSILIGQRNSDENASNSGSMKVYHWLNNH